MSVMNDRIESATAEITTSTTPQRVGYKGKKADSTPVVNFQLSEEIEKFFSQGIDTTLEILKSDLIGYTGQAYFKRKTSILSDEALEEVQYNIRASSQILVFTYGGGHYLYIKNYTLLLFEDDRLLQQAIADYKRVIYVFNFNDLEYKSQAKIDFLYRFFGHSYDKPSLESEDQIIHYIFNHIVLFSRFRITRKLIKAFYLEQHLSFFPENACFDSSSLETPKARKLEEEEGPLISLVNNPLKVEEDIIKTHSKIRDGIYGDVSLLKPTIAHSKITSREYLIPNIVTSKDFLILKAEYKGLFFRILADIIGDEGFLRGVENDGYTYNALEKIKEHAKEIPREKLENSFLSKDIDEFMEIIMDRDEENRVLIKCLVHAITKQLLSIDDIRMDVLKNAAITTTPAYLDIFMFFFAESFPYVDHFMEYFKAEDYPRYKNNLFHSEKKDLSAYTFISEVKTSLMINLSYSLIEYFEANNKGKGHPIHLLLVNDETVYLLVHKEVEGRTRSLLNHLMFKHYSKTISKAKLQSTIHTLEQKEPPIT